MAKHSIYFHELGIFGWGEIEPVILSAIIADKSILLIGGSRCKQNRGLRGNIQGHFGG